MPTDSEPVTLFEIVRAAVDACDDGTSEGLTELLERFEDAEEPVAGIADEVEQRLDEALGPADADEDEAPLTMARAVIVYLAHRRDELEAAPVELLRLAARAEFHGHPPEPVARWLALQGVDGV